MRLVLFTLPVYLLLTAAPVLAEKPSAPEPFPHVAVRLSFKTIDGCPGERAFRAEVASWVGYDPFSPEGEDLITIWFERAGPLFMVGVSLWAGVNFNLLNLPLAFELDLRSTWSVVPAKVPLPSQSIVAVRTAYVSGVVAGCWRGSITVCPLLEVGRASYSQAGTIGEASRSSILIAAGLRAVYARPITERFVLRGLVEVEGIPRPFSISDEAGHRASTPSPVSLTLGIGFGGSP